MPQCRRETRQKLPHFSHCSVVSCESNANVRRQLPQDWTTGGFLRPNKKGLMPIGIRPFTLDKFWVVGWSSNYSIPVRIWPSDFPINSSHGLRPPVRLFE